jgi:hypothetical protein
MFSLLVGLEKKKKKPKMIAANVATMAKGNFEEKNVIKCLEIKIGLIFEYFNGQKNK